MAEETTKIANDSADSGSRQERLVIADGDIFDLAMREQNVWAHLGLLAGYFDGNGYTRNEVIECANSVARVYQDYVNRYHELGGRGHPVRPMFSFHRR